jgi:hypothetical protein
MARADRLDLGKPLLKPEKAHATALKPLRFEGDEAVGDGANARTQCPSGCCTEVKRKDCRWMEDSEVIDVVVHGAAVEWVESFI